MEILEFFTNLRNKVTFDGSNKLEGTEDTRNMPTKQLKFLIDDPTWKVIPKTGQQVNYNSIIACWAINYARS